MFNKTTSKIFLPLLLVAFMAFAALPAYAKVSIEEANRLKNDLTPTGAIRAGNADGTIPAWEGGLTEIPDHVTYDPASEAKHPNPYADDKVLFTITAQNVDQYADKLTPGLMEMFKTYPDTWKMHIYPTRRPYAAPQEFYDRVYQNALNAETINGGDDHFKGDYGGYPFPIPKKGVETILNCVMGYWSPASTVYSTGMLVFSNGDIRNTGGDVNTRKDLAWQLSKEEYQSLNMHYHNMIVFETPPRRKGELVYAEIFADTEGRDHSSVWRYLPGQRRIRRAPDLAYDTPLDSTGGYTTVDDYYLWNGDKPDRYDWKLNGKKEKYIPYDNYVLNSGSQKEICTPYHVNPELIRWELHRVWEVDSTLKEGKRHVYARRVFHLDEDSWLPALRDAYDNKGNLWRFALGTTIQLYDVQVFKGILNMYIDFETDTYALHNVTAGLPKSKFNLDVPDSYLTLQSLRKMGRR